MKRTKYIELQGKQLDADEYKTVGMHMTDDEGQQWQIVPYVNDLYLWEAVTEPLVAVVFRPLVFEALRQDHPGLLDGWKLEIGEHQLYVENDYDSWSVQCHAQGCNYDEADDPEWDYDSEKFTAALFARMQSRHTGKMMHEERKRIMVEEIEKRLLTQAQVPPNVLGVPEEQQRFSDTEQGKAIERAKLFGNWPEPERSIWEGWNGQ